MHEMRLKTVTVRGVVTNLEVKLIFSNFDELYFTKKYIGAFCNYGNFNSAEYM